MGLVLAIFSLVYQTGDFLFKAAVAYSITPEGEKEWADVIAAATGVGLVHPQYVAEALSEDGPLSDEAKISEDAANFVKGQEQQNTTSAPVPETRRMPLQHGRG